MAVLGLEGRSGMLRYTGHPFVDVGVATITAFAQKSRPEEVTLDDLRKVVAYIEEKYSNDDAMTSYLSVIFTTNSVYTQPAYKGRRKHEVHQFIADVMKGIESAESSSSGEALCAICHAPAYRKGFRQHVPLLTGEDVLNFFPNASPGLPLCAGCLLGIQALPLGALKCGGRALILHADDDAVTLEFAREHLEKNRAFLQMLSQADIKKYLDAKHVRTRVVERLCHWAKRQADQEKRAKQVPEGPSETRPISLTAYYFSNSGQGPDITIYPLPSQIVDFVRVANSSLYASAWNAIVRAAWWANQEASDEEDASKALSTRNVFYEDLFSLPENAPLFIRRYFLRQAYLRAQKEDPRRDYGLGRDLDLVSWPLTDLFLRKVLNMEKTRIEAIRMFGDRLAELIATQNDRSLWFNFYTVNNYHELRNILIRVSAREVREGRSPLITFDEFITLFEAGEDVPYVDWRLARDLVLIRVIEQLHQKAWFRQHPDVLVEAVEESTNEGAKPTPVS